MRLAGSESIRGLQVELNIVPTVNPQRTLRRVSCKIQSRSTKLGFFSSRKRFGALFFESLVLELTRLTLELAGALEKRSCW